ncbi:MAG: Npt1/Npt2 family nucleotide transporter, partial [Desulfobacteraceae bacterium]
GAQFLFCGLSVICLRFLIPFGFDIIYPILFMLKAQFEALLALLFWNLANDLFNTRQSKRLFPLITAGGILGQILGSFGTPLMARTIQFDNLLFVYLLITTAGAGVVWAMSARFPSLLVTETASSAPQRTKETMADQLRNIWPLLKSSIMIRIMILLTFMPNVVIPIMNYQFNYAVDNQFATEAVMIQFFGYFRGVLNIVSLIILMFVGKIYGRWGLPIALMFHPFNYILAFGAFLLRFDVLAAIYARMSVNILRSTINIPANAMAMGLFPESYRALVRPFLRGPVVRLALILGSSLILVSDRLFHPRYLSLVALPFVLGWLAGPILLKRRYSAILLDLIQQNQLDLKSMNAKQVGQLFGDRKMQDQLIDAFHKAPADKALWYARLLKQLHVPDLDRHLLRRIIDLAPDDQAALAELLSPTPPLDAIPLLNRLAEQSPPAVTTAIVKAAISFKISAATQFDYRKFIDHPLPEIRGVAAAGLYRIAPRNHEKTLQQWLDANDAETRLAGIIAAGAAKDIAFAPALMTVLNNDREPRLIAAAIESLHQVGLHDLNQIVGPFLTHEDRNVRRTALASFHVVDKPTLLTAIQRLADESPMVRGMAAERIVKGKSVDGKTLIKSLDHPNAHLREHIFELLDHFDIKDLDLYRYAHAQLDGAYKYLSEHQGISKQRPCDTRDQLMDHLKQQSRHLVDRVLRVLAVQDRSGQLRIINRGLLSPDHRQQANSQEALEDRLDHKLSSILFPLLEDASIAQKLSIGRRHFELPDFGEDSAALYNHLILRHDDWVTVLLALQLVAESNLASRVDPATVQALTADDNPHIRGLARRVAGRREKRPSVEEHAMVAALMLPDIILRLKSIEIFESLSVGELAAVASVTEEATYDDNQIVIQQGDPGDSLYLIIEGEVAVLKRQKEGNDLELDRIESGDHFGEMALFEQIPRTATIRTVEPCRMLVLHKQQFDEMVREYPQIALGICKVLSSRIRKLHQKMT